jgi:molybdenum cofactor biosynthesis protein B
MVPDAETLPDTVHIHKEHAPLQLTFAVAIVSTTRYAEFQNGELETDQTFPVIEEEFGKYPDYAIQVKGVLPDDIFAIREFLATHSKGDEQVDVIILSGGTGLSAKDQTVEACRAMLDKEIPGFGEIFRSLSYEQVGTAAMMSRSTAGIIAGIPVFCLPGSPKAVQLGLSRIILPEIAHVIYELRKE